jgi:adenosylhomocysteine nucleosidase
VSRRIAILAALPSELKPLVKGWQRQPAGKYVSLWTTVDADGDELIAVCAGMGATAARRAFQAAEDRGPLDLVLSVGLAGATDAGVRLGTVACLSEVIDVQTGERFTLTEGERRLRLATVTRTAGVQEKARLFASYAAVLVDMEAATVARLAAMRSVPMCCFKAVSDAADANLPEIDRFVDANGQLSVPRFLAYLAVHPGQWSAVARLAKSSRSASEELAESLRAFLRHKDWSYTNRTGDIAKSA